MKTDKTIIILFLLLLQSAISQAQSLTGIVCDKRTNHPIPGVIVYFHETTIHAVTDAQGRYEIKLKEMISASLVFQHVSYETYIFNDVAATLPDTVFLAEKVNQMEDIVIRPSSVPRKKMLNAFRTHFLGSSRVAKKCRITNEDDIYFMYDEDQKLFTAYADKPLIIVNPLLGYEISYELAHFAAKYSDTPFVERDVRLSMVGNPLFRDISAPGDESIKRRRKSAYNNSLRQFFRAVYHADFSGTPYRFCNNPFYANMRPIERIVDLGFRLENDSSGLKKLIINTGRAGGNVYISYQSGLYSKLTLVDKTYLIDSYGNQNNSFNIFVSGEMGKKRTGDKLPADYLPE